jgi:uncharacterized low-complexity protein
MKKKSLKPIAAALGTTFVVTLAASPIAQAGENPFTLNELSSGYMVAEAEGKCGENKEAEGKCGDKKDESEGKCGDEGAMKDESEGKCGEKKEAEGKCGS